MTGPVPVAIDFTFRPALAFRSSGSPSHSPTSPLACDFTMPAPSRWADVPPRRARSASPNINFKPEKLDKPLEATEEIELPLEVKIELPAGRKFVETRSRVSRISHTRMYGRLM